MTQPEPAQPTYIKLSLDATLELLFIHEHRALLQYLMETADHTATVTELVSHLIQRHTEQTGEHPPHNRVESGLYQSTSRNSRTQVSSTTTSRSEEVRYWSNDRSTGFRPRR